MHVTDFTMLVIHSVTRSSSPSMSRCKWSRESFLSVSGHKPLPDKVVQKLRQVAQAPAPTLRPSIKCVCMCVCVRMRTSMHGWVAVCIGVAHSFQGFQLFVATCGRDPLLMFHD